MARDLAHKSTSNREPTGEKTSAREDGPDSAQVADLFDRHIQALYSMARLWCADPEAAAAVTAVAFAESCAKTADPEPGAERRRLAAALWRTCTRTQPRQAPHAREQAVLGLVLFGHHTYRQAAAVTGLSPDSAARCLTTSLRHAARPPRPPRGSGTPRQRPAVKEAR